MKKSKKEVKQRDKTTDKTNYSRPENPGKRCAVLGYHSAADYKDELEPVTLTPARHLARTMNVRFDEHDMEKLQQVAEQKGIGPSTLARMWIKERLHNNP
jgi:hypothetical protein